MPNQGRPFLTAKKVLELLKGVDGTDSGLDADLLDGLNSTTFVHVSDYEDADVLEKIKNVDGAGSGLDADLLDGYHATSFPRKLTGDLTVTVGSGGDFSTITAAIDHLLNTYYPHYRLSGATALVTIRLLSGFTMSEQVFVRRYDLSWIRIISDSATVTVNRSALTSGVSVPNVGWTYYPAFCALEGGALPRIETTFVMDTSGTGSYRVGILALQGSKVYVKNGCGFKNAYAANVIVALGSYACLDGGVFTGVSNGTGIFVYGAVASANYADCSNCYQGIMVFGGGIVSAYNAKAQNCQYGIVADAGIIGADGSDTSGCSSYGFNLLGGIILANNSTGTANVTANTVSASGIFIR